jgi:hypothetical protein
LCLRSGAEHGGELPLARGAHEQKHGQNQDAALPKGQSHQSDSEASGENALLMGGCRHEDSW